MLSFVHDSLWENQKNLCLKYQKHFCLGLDEAGRGALAGPVVAAAVCLDKDMTPFYLNDSKRIGPKKRKIIYHEMITKNVPYGIGIVEAEEIDRCNILEATKKAMKEAYSQCQQHLGRCDSSVVIAIDGNMQVPLGSSYPLLSLVKGDTLVSAIAAASIIAKVSRDSIMEELHHQCPLYGFSKHKGYGTREHFEAISLHGYSPYHRRSFSIRGTYAYYQ